MRLVALAVGTVTLVLSHAAVGSAGAQLSQLLPGVTYETDVQFTPFGPVVLHIVRGPRPGGLYSLTPELSNETVEGRERLSTMEKRLSGEATAVGINGDYFAFKDGLSLIHI